MNRWFPSFGGAAVLGALALAGCTPNNSVKAGAPVLTQMIIVQPGGKATTILPSTGECGPGSSGTTDGGDADGGDADGGASDAGATGVTTGAACAPATDVLCQQKATADWCSCVADGMDPTMGTWSCAPFAATAGVIAVFDRLLSTAPFDAVDGGATAAVVTTPPFVGDYASNGSTTGLIIPLFSQYLFGNFRFAGPSIFLVADPELPSGTKVTVTLNKSTVTAKDGTTSFTGEGLLQDGSISFNTAPFAANIATPPPAPTPDGGPAPTPDGASLPDNTPVTVTFTNFVSVDDVKSHISVTAGGAAVPVDIASSDNVNVTITPTATWPASSTITITVDKDTADLLGEKLGVPATVSFMTTAM